LHSVPKFDEAIISSTDEWAQGPLSQALINPYNRPKEISGPRPFKFCKAMAALSAVELTLSSECNPAKISFLGKTMEAAI
jgi:hypothetical protein